MIRPTTRGARVFYLRCNVPGTISACQPACLPACPDEKALASIHALASLSVHCPWCCAMWFLNVPCAYLVRCRTFEETFKTYWSEWHMECGNTGPWGGTGFAGLLCVVGGWASTGGLGHSPLPAPHTTSGLGGRSFHCKSEPHASCRQCGLLPLLLETRQYLQPKSG